MGVKLASSSGGSVEIVSPVTASNYTATLQPATGTLLTSNASGDFTTTNFNSASTFGFKNRLINGAMMIDQRNAGASVTVTSSTGYTLDRWSTGRSVDSKYSVQQNAGSVTPPVNFKNYLGVTSLSSYAVTASDYFFIYQPIEGLNISDLNWGTANASTVTLSFQVYSSLTGTFGGSLRNSAANRSYPFTYTISSANTWTSVSVTIPGDTTGTWLTTNGVGIYVQFGLGVGSTNSGTAGSWAAASYLSATGATSVVGTNGATFYITGVQLEKGSTATSFDYRPYGTELQLCQRYYYSQAFKVGNYGTTSSGSRTTVYNKVSMRTTPTYALSGETKSNVGTTFVDVSTTENATAYYLASSNDMVIYTATMTGTAEL